MEALLGYTARTAGAPQRSRLAVDAVLARLLGFESNRPLPSEATFSRAFAEFARTGLPAKVHETPIRQHLGQVVTGHIARNSTAIHARERAQYSQAETAALNESKVAKQAKLDKTAKQPERRGRPPEVQLMPTRPAKPNRVAAFQRSYCKHQAKRWLI